MLLPRNLTTPLNNYPDEENCQSKFNNESDSNKISSSGDCPEGTFACLTGRCVAQGWVCDRENDCMDAPPGKCSTVLSLVSICVSFSQFAELLNTQKNVPFNRNLHFNLQF